MSVIGPGTKGYWDGRRTAYELGHDCYLKRMKQNATSFNTDLLLSFERRLDLLVPW